MTKPTIAVIGSINMDMVTETKQIPAQGETVLGTSFQTFHGGKGANQAVSASRLGAAVTIFGCVGNDAFGELLLDGLKTNEVSTEKVEKIDGVSSGVATIVVSGGDNRIIVAPGANAHVTPDYIDRHADAILAHDVVVVQLEIPLETVARVVELCAGRVPVILNPAPARELPAEVVAGVTYMTPNETEFAALFGGAEISAGLADKLVVTLGSEGAAYFSSGEKVVVAGFKANVVDTTGAGDTFNGAFAVRIAEGAAAADAIRFANVAAALSVEQPGAQSGMPLREAVEDRLR